MRYPTVERSLLLLVRLVAFAGAFLTVASIVILVYLFFNSGPSWDVGVVPLVFLLQIVVAAWVVWSISRFGLRALVRVLLLAGGASFLGLYGWYFMLMGAGGKLIAFGNLLYLAAGLLAGIHLAIPAHRRTAG